MNNNNFLKMKNKRADFSVVIFVLLVLILSIYSLYVIISQENKAQQRLNGYGIAEELLLEKKDLEYRMTKLGEECMVSIFGPKMTYFDYEKWIEERSGENLASLVRKCLKEKSNSLAEDIDKERFLKVYGIYSRIGGEVNLKLEANQDDLLITLEDFRISKPNSPTTYEPDLTALIYLNRIGLIHPEKFKEMIECEDENDIEEISKNLFEIDIEEGEGYKVYNFASKKEFLIENEFKKIEFAFHVPKKNP